MITYARARKDFEYLETLHETNDIVEIEAELMDFLREPTKKFATILYLNLIQLWFVEHCETVAGENKIPRKLKALADRYNERF